MVIIGQTIQSLKNGHPVGSFYGHKVAGIFQNQSEIDALNKQAAEKTNGEIAVYQTAGD